MDMAYLANMHFPSAYKPVSSLNLLAQRIFETIRIGPWATTGLRNEVVHETGCSKNQFDTALKHLQISLNIVRACGAEQDTWLTFREVYSDIWKKHVADEE